MEVPQALVPLAWPNGCACGRRAWRGGPVCSPNPWTLWDYFLGGISCGETETKGSQEWLAGPSELGESVRFHTLAVAHGDPASRKRRVGESLF